MKSNSVSNVTSNFFVCDFCGKTNSYATNSIDETICGGCVIENASSGSAEMVGAAGTIQVNRHHECRRRELIIDISLVSVVALVVIIGGMTAILKNRRKKSAGVQATRRKE